ncbi:MAG: hypothetical protein AABY22_24460 [Nanoarchaeota archaeon]
MELPKIKMDNKTYFIDKRLGEIRNIDNPFDSESVSIEVIDYWKKNNIKEV